MITKYILHGGNTSEENLDNHAFFRELANINKRSPQILLCYFAKDDSKWEELAEQDSKKIISTSNKDINFEIATKKRFREQAKKSDLMYFRGGHTKPLLDTMKDIRGWENDIEGKIIAGSSAGTYLVSSYYHTNNTKQLGEGFGLLDIKTYAHFDEKKDQDILEKLSNAAEDLPILAIPEYKFVVMYN